MIQGSFDEGTKRPFVQGLLVLPRLHISGPVDFLFDTGADVTMLHPSDGLMMRLDYNHLNGKVPMTGLGARTLNYQEQAFVIFADISATKKVRLPGYKIDILIPKPTTNNKALPSLLGRDISNRWHIDIDQSRNYILFDITSSDFVLPI